MMTIILINCTDETRALEAHQAVENGDLWDVSLSGASSSNKGTYCLIKCTEEQNLNLIDAIPDFDLYSVELSQMQPDDFEQTSQRGKMWFLRGRL